MPGIGQNDYQLYSNLGGYMNLGAHELCSQAVWAFIPMKSEKVKVLVAQLCLTLCYPMDRSTPGSSVHGIL